MSGPNFNITDRLPATKDPLDIVDVYSANDLPAEITAPDGVLRRPLKLSTKYIVHKEFTWPRLLVPKATNFSKFQFLSIKGIRSNISMLIDGDTTPHIWGRDIGVFQFNDVIIKDISNSGAGRGTVLVNLVGGSPFSFFIKQFMVFFNFKKLGALVDIGIQSSQTFQSGVESGWVFRVNPNTFQNSFVVSLQRMIQAPTDPAMKKPFMVFQGAAPIAVVSNGNIELQSGDNAFHIDSAFTGEINMLGNAYTGVAAGNFFRPDISKSLTAMAEAQIGIASFQASAVNPSTETQVNFSTIQKFTRGQVILIADATQGSFNAQHTIVRVADDQKSFDISVVFSTSSTANLKITRITSVAHGMVEGETNTISNTSAYNGTEKNLFVTDDTFDIPVAFVTNEASGTVDSTGKNEKSIDISAIANSAQKDSRSLAFGEMNTNTSVSAVTDGVYTNVVFSGFTANAVTERWTLTNATNGVFRYDGSKPFTGKMTASINAIKTGGVANYRFTTSVNGATPVFATAMFAPMEIGSTKVSTVLLAPVNIVTGDTVQLMIAGDGTAVAATITDCVIEITE